MPEASDGESIARQRIAEEAERQTGFLDLGGLGLTKLPPELFQLRHLRTLNLGCGIRREDGTWHEAYDPQRADNLRNEIAAELPSLSQLPELRELSVAHLRVVDLTSLKGLTELWSLDCGGTQVTDLTPLAALTALQSLECNITRVADLRPLASLNAPRTLVCSGTQVADLTPLSGLPALQSLDCSYTQVADLTPLSGLPALQSLTCSGTQVADLMPLSGLPALQSLTCSGTQVADLAPLSCLPALQSLDCSGTQVADLAPLSGLPALQSLNCRNTQVADLTPLSGLPALQSLDCSFTQVADLTPLSGLPALQSLTCSRTQVADLTPLSGLPALQSLDCSSTQVADLTPLSGLPALQSLVCWNTQVTDLAPLSGLLTLQSLDCDGTQVADLAPLSGLPALQSLDCSGCTLIELPEQVRNLESLQPLRLFRCRVPDVPAEVLSQNNSDNCLATVRAHFRDLEAGADAATDVKLIVLGNGRVGKTQICRRLRNEDYDATQPSTHGILVTSAALDTGDPESTRLNIWDFGGQNLYHGTHALFLRTSAVFLLVWARETEDAKEHTHQGVIFRNQPLPYWLAYVSHLAAADSPVLLVQTRCDRPQDEALAPPVSDDAARPDHCVSLHYSALNDRGRDSLDRSLREAVAWLRERQGIARIGIGRLKVQRALQALRDADAAVPPDQRQYRTITPVHFQRLCDEAGNVSSPEYLLQYLHNAGIVFHRPGLFHDSIVLDQGWALDAIYAVFNREKCYRELKRLRGRFTRPLLELLAWGDHSVAEQRLFLDMMQSCGVCFVHRRAPYRTDNDDTEYVAPDLLPEREAVQAELDGRWDATLPTETVEFDYEMLHPGLVRGIICGIGGEAGVDALYWRGGVCVYETRTRSHALIEQLMTDGWHGRTRVQTQGGQTAALRDQLAEWIEHRNNRDGLRARRLGPAPPPRLAIAEAKEPAKPELTDKPPGDYGPAPVPASTQAATYFVSYAWDDDLPDGARREAEVDRLCADAHARGIAIQRDKSVLRTGDSILAFMRRMGRADHVFVVLSEKYLRSAWCMTELFEIWNHSRGDTTDFLRRVHVYCLPDARISTLADRVEHAAWWKQQFDRIDALNRQHGIAILGTEGVRELYAMIRFYQHVADILHLISDTVRPRTFEELERYGFEDPPPPAPDDAG